MNRPLKKGECPPHIRDVVGFFSFFTLLLIIAKDLPCDQNEAYYEYHQPYLRDREQVNSNISALCIEESSYLWVFFFPSSVPRLTASDIMEPNLTYVYPHTRVQSLVSILRTTVYHAFPVVTENRQNERDFMKGNILVSNNIHYKVCPLSLRNDEKTQQEIRYFL